MSNSYGKGTIMSRMNYEHLIALVEECHRFRDLPFQRVSFDALCGDERLIDEYMAVLLRAAVSYTHLTLPTNSRV